MESLFSGSLAPKFTTYLPVVITRGSRASRLQYSCKDKIDPDKKRSKYMPIFQYRRPHFPMHHFMITRDYCTCDQRLFIHTRCTPKQLLNAASSTLPEDHCTKEEDAHKSLMRAFDVFYRFLRPNVTIETVLSIVTFSFLGVERLSDISPLFFTRTFEAIVAAICMQIYVVGFNQLTDIEIDKVNKPYLPLASGELSVAKGAAISSIAAIMSFLLAWNTHSWPLFLGLLLWFLLGTAYSINLPLFRWKKYPLMAALCIVGDQVVVIPVAFYRHTQSYVKKTPIFLSRPWIFGTIMLTLFFAVLTFYKDIPDIEGDQKYGIKSLAARMGPKKMFWSCVWFLQVTYVVAMLMGLYSSCTWSKGATVLSHALMALVLWLHAKAVNLSSKTAIQSFYLFMWKGVYGGFIVDLSDLTLRK